MEVFTLIARKKNVALVFVSYLLVALAAISLLTICIGFAPGILFAVVFGLIAYLMIMAQNTEFEYSYFDGELRFAKIKNKSRRKRLGIYSMESVAAIAPRITTKSLSSISRLMSFNTWNRLSPFW